ncbi:MAG: GNAT family N-acetyltransferase [Limnochordia bacterium]|nr:GNAT family N-acetyltransferase [Limnochordia bacterium]
MSLRLVFPTENYENEWHSIIKEFEDAGEKMTPYSLKGSVDDYTEYLRITRDIANGVNLNGMVQADTYFLVNGESTRILGATNIRYALNDNLFSYGGHIGYGVRPRERKKGYAGKMLELALEICRTRGMERVLLTCDNDNIGSVKTMLKNGAALENEVQQENKIVQRYWITL